MRPYILLFSVLAAPALAAQQPRVFTADDYARAERFMGYNTTQLVSGGAVQPTWLPDGRFWYRNQTASAVESVLVDPVRRTREHADAAALPPAAPRPRPNPALPINSAISPDSTKAAFIRDWNLW